ncbi:MAG: ParB/RepB/Spo0J family partition protein [Planctomycetes bacterium]|nr:ParB/RepB/Spo0J family partition protein [Planctomycetota bacterium]MCB9905114.1 ParB/RepB/Spo0J family partition protein [Planctomycetota bacterium]
MERRLGRGLGSLLGDSVTNPETPAEAQQGLARELRLDEIRPNPQQPRTVFDPGPLEELRDSIRNHGVLQPVVVRRTARGYELIAGERRWRGARLAGLERIPAVVKDDIGDDEMLELALVENVQRRDLDAMEKARGYQGMIDALGLTQEQVAQKVGLKRSTVANHLRLLELPERAQAAIREGLISMGHARALLGLSDEALILTILAKVAREGLSVRQTEALVRDAAGAAQKEAPAKTVTPAAPWIVELQDRMREHLGTKVQLHNKKGYRGQITIEYYGREDLDRLLGVLAPRESL